MGKSAINKNNPALAFISGTSGTMPEQEETPQKKKNPTPKKNKSNTNGTAGNLKSDLKNLKSDLKSGTIDNLKSESIDNLNMISIDNLNGAIDINTPANIEIAIDNLKHQKETRSKRLQLVITPSTYELLKQRSWEEHKSVNEYINSILEKELNK